MTLDMTPADDRDPRQRFADKIAADVADPAADFGDPIDPLDLPDDTPPITEAEVRAILVTAGGGLGLVVPGRAYVADAWDFTPAELDALAPPLTRIINRRPALKRLATAGDPIAIAFALGRYGLRNVAEIAEARQLAADAAALSAQHPIGG